MKEKILKAYAVIAGQVITILLVGYMAYNHLSKFDILLKPVKVHLTVQLLLGLIVWYATSRFINIIKASSQMRKIAREQRESNSKRIETLILVLIVAIVFASLFYTAPYRRYYSISIEYGVYFYNTFAQLLLLISVMGTSNHTSQEFIKKKQTYAGVGVVLGVLLFYVYYQLMA